MLTLDLTRHNRLSHQKKLRGTDPDICIDVRMKMEHPASHVTYLNGCGRIYALKVVGLKGLSLISRGVRFQVIEHRFTPESWKSWNLF